MELRSKSRDLNAILKAEHREYIKDNPDIVNLIGDFLQVRFIFIKLIPNLLNLKKKKIQ